MQQLDKVQEQIDEKNPLAGFEEESILDYTKINNLKSELKSIAREMMTNLDQK